MFMQKTNKFFLKMLAHYGLNHTQAARLCGQSLSAISKYCVGARLLKLSTLEIFMRNLAKMVDYHSTMLDHDLTEFEDLKYSVKAS